MTRLQSRPAAETDSVARLRVLLIDDDELVSQSVGRCLQRLGFEVTTAHSGEAALALAAETAFDAIVTDQTMPGMTGEELVRQLLARDPQLGPRLVLMSGDIESPPCRKIVATTGCRAIEKPFHLADLALTVRAATGAQGSRSAR
jgi:two-component system, NtrC family, response regulator AtoC